MPPRLYNAILDPIVLFWTPPHPLNITKAPGSMVSPSVPLLSYIVSPRPHSIPVTLPNPGPPTMLPRPHCTILGFVPQDPMVPSRTP